MEYRNTTDIPLDLIKVAIQFAGQSGVEIKRIEVRNKEEGIYHGDYGKYYEQSKKIRLIVPPVMNKPIQMKLRHFGKHITFQNRIEFVVAVMAHELRHGYQYQVMGMEFACTAAKEYDAEKYEWEKLNEWRQIANG